MRVQPPPTEVLTDERVWTSADVFDAIFERRVRALVAIHQTVAERPTLDGSGFTALYDFVRGADADAFSGVWSAPAAHAWSRRTFDALGRSLEDPEDAAATARLATQLRAFAVFALSVAHRSEVELTLPHPIEVPLPLNLPGTRLVLEGEGLATLRRASDLDAVERPCVRVEGSELGLVPEALAVPGAVWEDVEPALAAGAAFHQRHAPVLEAALRAIARHHPTMFSQIRDQIPVVALQPEAARKYPNASSSEFPGAVLLGANDDPLELGDHLLHEFAHNRLFALEAWGGALLEEDASDRYYSPWREELRSMRGLVHGAYVFIPVHDYWASVAMSGASADVRSCALEHATRAALDLAVALGQIERHARLTPFGVELVRCLSRRVDAIRETSGREASRATREAVRAHVRRFDVERQVSDLETGAS